MTGARRLYERATTPSAPLDALWHLDLSHTLFVGPLQYNASHQHGAPVFLAGLHGAFGLRVRNGSWLPDYPSAFMIGDLSLALIMR
jgi:hypothetical protein